MSEHPGGAFTTIETVNVSGTCITCKKVVTGILGIRAIGVQGQPGIEFAACDDTAAHVLGVLQLEALMGVQVMRMQRPKTDPQGRN